MKSMGIRKWTVILLVFSMMLSSFSFVSAAGSSDVKGHWAESQLNTWIEKGLITGYADGIVKPDNPVTRAELISLINRAFGFKEKADVIFSDMQSDNWAYGDVAIAIKADYIKGNSDGTFAPDNKTSRQEVAVIIARLLKLPAVDQNTVNFSDAEGFASWSKEAISSVAGKKIMQGYEDQTFKPENQITRAEAVVTLDRALQAQMESQNNTYNTAGTYGPVSGTETVSGDVVVNVTGVTLQNMVINGNLLLAAGIGSGDAFLKNVTVKGTTTVQGGGDHSIHFENGMFVKVIVDKKGGTVRLVVKGSTFIEELDIESSVTLELGKDSKISSLMIDALLKVLGQGTIEKVIIGDEGKGSTFEKQPVKLEGTGATSPTPAPGSPPTTPNTVTSASVIDVIYVDMGTSLSTVIGEMPTQVKITLSDNTTPTVNVTWDGGTPPYDGSTLGMYTFTGLLAMPNNVTNPNHVNASVNIVVIPATHELEEAALAFINATVQSGIDTGNPTAITITQQQFINAGVANSISNFSSFYITELIHAKQVKANADLLLIEVQAAIDTINIAATRVPATSAIMPVNYVNVNMSGDHILLPGEAILLIFNVRLIQGADAAIQAAVDTAFGSGKATVTPFAGNSFTFTININSNIDLSNLSPQSALITLPSGSVHNYINGAIVNSAPISFLIEDNSTPTPQLFDAVANISNVNEISLTFNNPLNGSIGNADAFSVSGVASNPSVTQVDVMNDKVFITLSSPIVWSDHVTVSYTQLNNSGDLQTVANVKVQNFANANVRNYIVPPLAAIQSVKTMNGTVEILLDIRPVIDPVAADFTVSKDTVPLGSLPLTMQLPVIGFHYDKANKKVTFNDVPSERGNVWQSVSVVIEYKTKISRTLWSYLAPVVPLGTLVTSANNLYAIVSNHIGSAEGEYAQADINDFAVAIAEADAVRIDANASQAAKDTASDELEAALFNMETSVHTQLYKSALLNAIFYAEDAINIAATMGQFELANLDPLYKKLLLAKEKAVSTTNSGDSQSEIDDYRIDLYGFAGLFNKDAVTQLDTAGSVLLDTATLDIGFGSDGIDYFVKSNVTLLSTGHQGTTITWTSSDNAVINASTGVVNQPLPLSPDATVTLTATVTKNGVTASKSFILIVSALAS